MLKWIEINIGVVAENARAIKKRLSPGVSFMAVIKEDAYGHGAIEIARTVLANGADELGVLTLDEATILRKAGIKAPILTLAPAPQDFAVDFIKLGVQPTVDAPGFLRALNSAAKSEQNTVYTIDIDSGLKRWGISPAELPEFLKTASKCTKVRATGLSTHISYAPQKNMIEAEEKLSSFQKLGKLARGFFPDIKLYAANSSVLCDFPHWQMDGVRIGNLLYGLYPSKIYLKKTKGPPIPGLNQPWKFYARIISVKKVKKGESLGYASDFVACKAMTIATVPAGYADGLTLEPTEKSIKLSAGQNYWGILNGKIAPFVGKSAIAHTLLDISNCPGAAVGDKVLLPVRRTAASARVPRIYLSN